MKKALFITLFVIVASCTTRNVAVDYDRSQDFAQIRSYSLTFQNNGNLNEFDVNRVADAIQQTMMTKGVFYKEDADVYIQLLPEEYISKHTSSIGSVGVGGGGRHVFGGLSVGIPITTQKLNQNFLVSMYRSDNNRLIWQGTLNLSVGANASAEERRANIEKGIQKLFNNYPPQAK